MEDFSSNHMYFSMSGQGGKDLLRTDLSRKNFFHIRIFVSFYTELDLKKYIQEQNNFNFDLLFKSQEHCEVI